MQDTAVPIDVDGKHHGGKLRPLRFGPQTGWSPCQDTFLVTCALGLLESGKVFQRANCHRGPSWCCENHCCLTKLTKPLSGSCNWLLSGPEAHGNVDLRKSSKDTDVQHHFEFKVRHVSMHAPMHALGHDFVML